MTETQTVLERPLVRVLEGTPAELTAYLATAPQEAKLKLLLPEKEKAPQKEETFEEICAMLQADFDASGMTDDELGELIDAEIKEYRAERRAKGLPTL